MGYYMSNYLCNESVPKNLPCNTSIHDVKQCCNKEKSPHGSEGIFLEFAYAIMRALQPSLLLS